MSTEVIRPQDRQFGGHPIGLWVLFTTEMWERFCYYGMRAFLVLYLISALNDNNPGFGWQESSAYRLYGWFTGLVYLTPLLCGWIADRFIGTHRSVLFGGTLIAIGEFCLFLTEYFRAGATETVTFTNNPAPCILFFAGLLILVIGNGFFKPCISVMVGELYGPNDARRDAAFTYFYMGINVGAFLAPFVAGTIAEKVGWSWGFLTACIGMIFGLCTYSFFRPKYLGRIGIPDERPKKSGDAVKDDMPLTKVEVDRVTVILVLTLFCIAFWSVFEQAGSSLNTFAKNLTDRTVSASVARLAPGAFLHNEWGDSQDPAESSSTEAPSSDRDVYTFPATWYQSVNALGIVLFAPLFGLMWSFLARHKKEPSTPQKFGWGLLLLGIAFLFMIYAALQAQETSGHAGPYWLFTTYIFCTLGELCLSPVGLSMVTRLAPKRYASLMMGVWFLSSAVAGYLSGYLAAVLGSSDGTGGQIFFCFGEKGGLADYFLLMTIIPIIAGIIVMTLVPMLKRKMHLGE